MSLVLAAAIASSAAAAAVVALARALGRIPRSSNAKPACNPELPMFRISQIFQKVVTTFHAVEATIENDVQRIYALLPSDLKSVVDQDVQIAKQYVSDAISQADSSLASHQQAIAMGVEEAIDTELALLTRGVSVPYNAFTNHAIDALVATAIAAAHNAGLSIKARMASGTAIPISSTATTSAATPTATSAADPTQTSGQLAA